jgi:putative ABC transport system substrate-binding protein
MQFAQLKRRDFITLLGAGAATWPLSARAQQSAIPLIGFLNPTSPDTNADRLRAFRQGLKEAGFIEGENLTIEYRWADGQFDRLPALAAELVDRRVSAIATFANAAFVAKSATTTIPLVFLVGGDPVKLGLVASLSRPGGNLTGVNFFTNELVAKRLELLRELVPTATRVTIFSSPDSGINAESTLRDVEAAARAIGLQIRMISTKTSREIDAAFTTFVQDRPDALSVGLGPFLLSRRVQLVHLATRRAIPAIYSGRDYAEAGGLISYGTNIADAYRQVGVQTGRILKGTKPADLPVVQSTKFELVINQQAARTLDLDVPATLLERADEVIE